HYPLAGCQQLLGQQVTQAAGALEAQARCGQAAAQSSSRRACDADARTRSSPSGSSAGLIATAVCEPSCGSTPIITATTTSPPIDAGDRGGHALFQGLTGCAPLSSHTTARGTGRLARR